MGFLISPRAFMTAGSGIGLSGSFFTLIIVMLVIVHVINARFAQTPEDSIGLFDTTGYGIKAFTLAFLSCSILGVAGYAFNEVFLFWFPNFLFSFIVLGCSMIACLTPPSIFNKIQSGAVALALLGVAVIFAASAGVEAPQKAQDPDFYAPYALNPMSEGLAFMASLFIGYELLRKKKTHGAKMDETTPQVVAIVAVGIVLALFSQAILMVSGSERLADSTVPHMSGARRILGQTGRYIMGGVVILGSFAAFNAVMMYLKRPFDDFFAMRQADDKAVGLNKRVFAAAIPALTISILLLMGFAGEPVTETYIAGGLGFWLLFYAANSLRAVSAASPLVKAALLSSAVFCAYLAYGAVGLAEEPIRAVAAPVATTIVCIGVARVFKKQLS